MKEAEAQGKGAVSLDGRLIDYASIRQAEVLVKKAEQIAGVYAARMETFAKANAPWEDRTGAARQSLTGLVERDGPAMPSLAPVLAEAAGYRDRLQQVLETGWVPTPWSAAALRAGLGFATWENLCGGSGLAGDEAAALVVAWVRAA